jgi:hypothetical protein
MIGGVMDSFKAAILTIMALTLLCGVVAADTGTAQMPETQGFTTGTTIQALGSVTETDGLTWILTTDEIPPDLPLGVEIYYTTSYSENTIADQGLVSYTKSSALDTAAKVTGQYNLDTAKVVEFVGLDTGRMITSEDTIVDGAMEILLNADEHFICPFAAPVGSYVPAFCNIVEMGSSADLTIGSLATATDERHVVESGDPGVAVDYSIKLTGFGDVPAMGSAAAFINVHTQEGRQLSTEVEGFEKASDLLYQETTTAAGDISLFQKVMQYNSGITSELPTFAPD